MTIMINIESHGIYAGINAPIKLDDMLDIGGWLIPDIKPEGDSECDFFVDYKKGKSHLQFDEKAIRLSGSCTGYELSFDIAAVLSKMFEKCYFRKGYHSLHSSAVSKKGSAVLFLGPSHSGKSTLAAYLSMNYGLNYISGDRTLLKGAKIIGGTKKDMMRSGSLKFFNHNIPKRDISWLSTELIDFGRYSFLDFEMYDISSIFFIQHENSERYLEEIKKTDKRLIKLYDSLLFFVDKYPNLALKLNIPIPPISDMDVHISKLDFARFLARNIVCYSLSGNFDFMSKKVLEFLGGDS